MSAEETPARPLLRVVRGEPDDAELAALVAVVTATSGGAAPEAEPEPNAWNDRSRLVRTPAARPRRLARQRLALLSHPNCAIAKLGHAY